MKSLIASVVLVALMLTGIVCNALYITHVSTEMRTMIEKLPECGAPDASEKANEILDYWEKRLPTVGLSVSYTVADRVSEQTVTLCACANSGDYYGYRVAVALLRDAVGDMCRLEKFSIANLL